MRNENFSSSTLLFYGTVEMDLKLDFLNRVRLNTIAGNLCTNNLKLLNVNYI